MKKIKGLLFLILLILNSNSFAQQNDSLEPEATTGVVEEMANGLILPHIQVIPIKDAKNDRQYELYIKLPEEYSENGDIKYPVLYFTDAMWHIEILSASTEYMLEDVIIVGISWQKDINGDLKKEVGEHVSRFRDYSISKHSKPEIQSKYQLGQANKHLDFIRNDVIKYIDSNYRTDPDSRTYFGYSLGGEFGAYILLTQPGTFDNYILGSPSIKSEVPYLSELNSKFGSFESNKNISLNANVFISYGTLEKEMEPIEEFVKLLNNRRDDGLSLHKEVIDGTHQTAFPMTAVRSIAWLSTLLDPESSIDKELSLWSVPQLNSPFINTSPEDRIDGVLVGELGIDGGDKAKILSLAQEIADGKHGRFDSFLITHKGKLIFESYYARGRINLPHSQASATKVYTSLLLGRAIQLGYLTMEDLDKPLVNFLKDLDPTKFVAGAERITLNHALTMRSGIRISEKQREIMNKNLSQLKRQGKVQALLEYSAPITEKSQVFKYSGDPDLVMQVIEAVTPGTAIDFIKTELLDKLGINNYRWLINEKTGLPEAGWQTALTSRAMIKLGQLAINKGKWNGEQLVPEAFVDKAINRIVLHSDDENFSDDGNVTNVGYGYYWWQADMKVGNKNYFTTSARGGGGQYIILIEELDLMVVVTAHDHDAEILQLTAERIIPAFVKQ